MARRRTLSDSAIRGIRRRYLAGERTADISSELSVSTSTVIKYVRGLKRRVEPNERLDGEEWRPCEGYEGYHVSNLGRVWSDGSVCRTVGFIKPKYNKAGYLVVSIKTKDGMGLKRVHRLVAMAFVPGRSFERNQVNHKNGIKDDPRAENLEWVTQSENVRHSFYVLGRAATNSKFTPEQVRQIRADERGCKKLAREYGVGHSTIIEIRNGRRYARVE